MYKKVCDDRLDERMQRTAEDQACRDPPARGHHAGFIGRRLPSPVGAAGCMPEFDSKPPLGALFLIFFEVIS